MQAEIQAQFEAIEQQRRAIETRACAFSDAQLNEKTEGAWSVVQITEHLVLNDEAVGQAQETPTAEDAIFRVLPRAARRALVLAAFKRDKTLPLPSPGLESSGTVPLPALLERWEQSRLSMHTALEAARGNKPGWSHPVLGPLTALQVLTLPEVHTAYHTRQMERLLNNIPAGD